jgi:UDP-N-acetylmuramyl pentapeptide phosphotransferase/UDP-N-acetylglucosamine-1-phosphate transferase
MASHPWGAACKAMIEQAVVRLLVLGPTAGVAAVLCWILLVLLRPWLARYAMAKPNARSSHRAPTPQGGGIAVVAAALVVAGAAIALSSPPLQNDGGRALMLAVMTATLAVVGAIDDVRTLPAAARLALQCIAVTVVLATLPHDFRVLPQVPWWIERAALLFAGVWFVNLVNFMDGVDWMTVAEVVPVSGALVLLGLSGTMALVPSIIAAALLGAMVGFAPFNKPVAKVFLGDVGSLPIGLLLGWLLLELAGSGHLAAALILPLYYLLDATITLVRRIARGERFWQAHRSHFYQRATDNGFSVPAIVAHVVVVNLALAALALATIAADNPVVSLVALAAGVAIVTWLLRSFSHATR